jgi:hypothetical protein
MGVGRSIGLAKPKRLRYHGRMHRQHKLPSAKISENRALPPAMQRRAAAELAVDIESAWAQCRVAVASGNKNLVKELHLRAKAHDAITDFAALRRALDKSQRYFPTPSRIEPARISPVVVPVVPNSLEERLFRVARGYWSMPYSKGYGRRLRFVIMDEHHEALIGIIGLQSPSADLACRDKYLGMERDKKLAFVNNTLDAYTVGATPAYAPLLAGKLVAGYLCSPKIRQEYWSVYGKRRTTQLRKRIPQPLLAITTASAFGRSSIYNRLKFENRLLARPLGYTQGYGTVHLEEVYPRMVEWLQSIGKHVPAGFGNGPKVRWQNIMNTLVSLRLPMKFLEHGICRQVFLFDLVDNLLAVCNNAELPSPIAFDDCAWGDFWRERWCLPRAHRDPDWHEFPARTQLRDALTPHSVDP